jgi:integrase
MKIRKTDKGQWLYDFHYKGKRYRKITGLIKADTLEAAENHLAKLRKKHFGIQEPEEQKPVLFEDFAETFMERYSKPNKRSWRDDENSLLNLKPFFRNRYLSSIGAEMAESYKAQRLAMAKKNVAQGQPKRKISPATVNRELALLKTIFSKAVEWGRIPANPLVKVKKFREDNIKERILTPEETGRLIGAAKARLRPILTIALNTGMRRNEILSLRWQDVNFAANYIQIEPARAKSGKGRKVPINDLVISTLRAMPKRHALVFYNPETRASVQDVKGSFKSACRRAGIKGLRLHDLRHTAATRMIEAGVDIATVSKILGHASIQMTMRYCHPTPENMRRAVDKLGEIFKKSVGTGENVDIKPEKKVFNIPVNHLLVYN